MLHEVEYRLYWVFWGIIPLVFAMTVFKIPAFQKNPEIQIVLTDSLPDHLYKANEVISIGFKTEALGRRQLRAAWTFGDTVYAWQTMPPDYGRIRRVSRLEWEDGEDSALGFKPIVRYDTLPPRLEYGWRSVIAVTDSAIKVRFPIPGRYRFKLTLQDTVLKQTYSAESLVEIVPATASFPEDTVVKIVGPTKGLVGEELIFSATGSKANFWYWKFGDGRNQDANQPQVLYSFSDAGRWEVTLKTDNPDQWVSHWVEIMPTWNADSIAVEVVDTSGNVIPRYQLDLRRRFQAIANTDAADSDRFYYLKSLIERNYLSDQVSPIYVWINSDKTPIDFDSYCQRIHFLEGELMVEKVEFKWDGDSTRRRIGSLYVQQRRLNN
jgi:hypothetical protein